MIFWRWGNFRPKTWAWHMKHARYDEKMMMLMMLMMRNPTRDAWLAFVFIVCSWQCVCSTNKTKKLPNIPYIPYFRYSNWVGRIWEYIHYLEGVFVFVAYLFFSPFSIQSFGRHPKTPPSQRKTQGTTRNILLYKEKPASTKHYPKHPRQTNPIQSNLIHIYQLSSQTSSPRVNTLPESR